MNTDEKTNKKYKKGHIPFYCIILRSDVPLKSSQRKNGPPRSAVITPTGISAGEISVLERVSQKIRNVPPKIKVVGVRRR